MNDLKTMTEKELREVELFWPKSIKELDDYIDTLVDRDHDYGTCVYAMSLSALAAMRYVSHKLGVSGFQASCAEMDFIKRSRFYKDGFCIVDYKNVLFPQYLDEEHFPTPDSILKGENRNHFIKQAKKLLQESPNAHPNVRKRWEYVANLIADAAEE